METVITTMRAPFKSLNDMPPRSIGQRDIILTIDVKKDKFSSVPELSKARASVHRAALHISTAYA